MTRYTCGVHRRRRPLLIVRALLASALLAVLCGRSAAIEIDLPRAEQDILIAGPQTAGELLAAWRGDPFAQSLRRSAPLIVLPADGQRVELPMPTPFADGLPVYGVPLVELTGGRLSDVSFVTTAMFPAGEALAARASRLSGAPEGGTRFEFLSAGRNPIRVPVRFGEDLHARVTYVPEPASWVLLAVGLFLLVALVALRRYRKRSSG